MVVMSGPLWGVVEWGGQYKGKILLRRTRMGGLTYNVASGTLICSNGFAASHGLAAPAGGDARLFWPGQAHLGTRPRSDGPGGRRGGAGRFAVPVVDGPRGAGRTDLAGAVPLGADRKST